MRLRVDIIDSDLEGLKVTNHLDAQACSFARSAFNIFAACSGSLTI